jgi:exopolysaccharide production protein ExoQ
MQGTFERYDLPRRRSRLRIGVAATLTFAALAALILDPLFGSLAALVFLLCGGLLLLTRPAHTLRSLFRFWYVLVLPAYCLLSVLWSQYPTLSLRYAVQLTLTVSIAIVIANRVAPLVLVRCLFGIYGIGVLGSILFGNVRDDIGAWLGIFGSKNAFAAVVSGFALASIAMLADRSAPRLVRLAAFAGLAVCPPLLLRAQSAGAILVLVPAASVALGVIFSRRMTGAQKTFVGMAMAGAAVLFGLVLVGYGDQLLASALDYAGKDTTLTGRTDLWDFGFDLIAENPLLGIGYQAFWVQGNPPAELLWAVFGIPTRMGFNFHNMYISNAVEIGLLGLAIEIMLLYGGWIASLVWALREPRPENAFLAAFVTLVICASFGEVAVFFQFSVTSIIVTAALVYAVAANAAWRAQARASRRQVGAFTGLMHPPRA